MMARRVAILALVVIGGAATATYGQELMDDISAIGECSDVVEAVCKKVKAGEGRLLECLSNAMKEDSTSVRGTKVTKKCKQEVRKFKKTRGKSFVSDTPLFDACTKDALKYCNDTDAHPEPGAVLACLRTHEDELDSACKKEVFRNKEDAAEDIHADAKLDEACSEDAKNVCSGVEEGEGRIQACLRKKVVEISWQCQEELFRQEKENAGDFRLNYELRNACMADAEKFCAKIKPGNIRVKDCLEDNREKPGFSTECKVKFEAMMARRASDFRLDAGLVKLCNKDISTVCGYEAASLDTIAGYDGRVVECLQDYKEELTSPACQKRVHKLTVRASQDIRMDEPLWDACYDDRNKLCPDVPPGSSRVFRCLQDGRESLSYECRATLFDQEMRFAESIDFKNPMKMACAAELERWCKDIPEGHEDKIRCLRDHDKDEEMNSRCRDEIKRDEIRAAQDYRLNYRLSKVCAADVDALCYSVCSAFSGQACGGTVLRCLQQKAANVTSDACRKEIFSVEKAAADDWRRDAILKEACKEDVAKFCKDKDAGNGRIHRCLRDNAKDLSPQCKKEELTLSIVQSQDVRLMPQLRIACVDEMKRFCKDVPPGGQRVFKCLEDNANAADFGAACMKEVEIVAKRAARNYKLDYGITKQCSDDIAQHCKGIESEGRAKVIICLMGKFNNTAEGCQHEVSRATKMALMMYHVGAPLTVSCDEDVQNFCPQRAQRPGLTFGALGSNLKCLKKRLDTDMPVGDECKKIMHIASGTPTSELLKNGGISAKQLAKEVVALEKKEMKRPGAGADPNSFITLTGWVALVAIGALVVMITGLIIFLVRKYRAPQRTVYTAVSVKDGGV